MDPESVLEFWFGPLSADPLPIRDVWFRKSDEFDERIRTLFGATIEAALRGELDGWSSTREGCRALILVLDQFTRNAFRGTPRSFAGDAQACSLSYRLLFSAGDRVGRPVERWFIYMPFEHSESLIDQYQSMRLFRQLAAAGLSAPLDWAQKHFDVIRRFGRFPHRNEILGRRSTPEETTFLQQPGSRF